MKIAITGHTQGIGKSLFDGFINQGHTVIGFNRSTTPNISTDENLVKLAELSSDCDLIVINAYDTMHVNTTLGFAQTTLLYEMFKRWKGLDKTIVVIGSRSSDVAHNKVHPYAIHKGALDMAVEQLRNVTLTHPTVINIRPGYVDTKQVAHVSNVKKMQPVDVFEILNMILNHKNLILDITFDSK